MSALGLVVVIMSIMAWPSAIIVVAVLLSPGSIRRSVMRQERKLARRGGKP